jgi:AbiV family abortive infection protein
MHDAMSLYDSGSYSTAVGLAMLAREELGKGRILLDLWGSGHQVTLEQVTAKLEDHLAKQQSAQLSVSISAPGDSRLGQIMRRLTAAPAGTAEFDRAADEKELQAAKKLARRRTPGDRADLRERSFYVDPDEAGTDWIRPVMIERQKALEVVLAAMNDYSAQLTHLTPEIQDERLRAALRAWPERPQLPDRRWPSG